MRYRIRAVLADDWQALRESRLRALSSDPRAFSAVRQELEAEPEAGWRERASISARGERYRWFAAVDEHGAWAGMALAHGGDDGARLYGMWVAPQARGHGIATRLCDACADWARERGYPELALAAWESNRRAVAAYLKAGFEIVACEPALSGTREGVVRMRRLL